MQLPTVFRLFLPQRSIPTKHCFDSLRFTLLASAECVKSVKSQKMKDFMTSKAKTSSSYSCFVDFSKAYDSVWRNGLLYRLILNGLSLKFILLIKSMYTELQAAVKLPNGVTPYFSSLVGVRQGCNLSPMLFNLFVNDIFDLFDNAKCDPVKLQTKLIHCYMYADDLLILSETENGLTKSLERLSNYAKKWKLKISAKKTKVIVFNKAGKIIISSY